MSNSSISPAREEQTQAVPRLAWSRPVAAKAAAPDRHRLRGHDYDDSPIDGLKILVVDNDYRNVFAMTAFLERGGAVVTVVESGARALVALAHAPDTDLVLMDVAMPGMDGYETTRAIRSNERLRSLPVIAVSGRARERELQSCIDAGVNEFVCKPVDTAELLMALERWRPVDGPSAA